MSLKFLFLLRSVGCFGDLVLFWLNYEFRYDTLCEDRCDLSAIFQLCLLPWLYGLPFLPFPPYIVGLLDFYFFYGFDVLYFLNFSWSPVLSLRIEMFEARFSKAKWFFEVYMAVSGPHNSFWVPDVNTYGCKILSPWSSTRSFNLIWCPLLNLSSSKSWGKP